MKSDIKVSESDASDLIQNSTLAEEERWTLGTAYEMTLWQIRGLLSFA